MKAAPFVRLALWTLVAAFVLWPDLFAPLLRPLAPEGMPVIYDRAGLADLTLWHLGLVVAAIIPSALLATALAILVTRPSGAEFLPLARALGGFGQTFPPVAVLALAVPLMGFGRWPEHLAWGCWLFFWQPTSVKAVAVSKHGDVQVRYLYKKSVRACLYLRS